MDTMSKNIKVNLENSGYNIIIDHNILSSINKIHKKYFQSRPKIIIYDAKLKNNQILKTIISRFGDITPKISVPSGEQSKSIERLEKIYNKLFSLKIDRKTVIYAVGGGVIGDLTGFVSATVMRGIDYVQIPTTLLSQIDSSVGGKTAINSKYGKNLIGSFYQPKLVIIDTKTLNTLPKKQMLSGYAEMVKYALIKDEKFFSWLEKNGKHVLEKKVKYLEYSIYECCKSKKNIVEIDEKEKGERALLNLGHTFAHSLERISNYKGFTHGEAVAVGIILAFKLSNENNYCNRNDLNRVIRHFKDIKLPINVSDIIKYKVNTYSIMSSMKLDKKTVNNIINFILVKGIGKAFICDKINDEFLKKFLDKNIAF
tara:strand:- start:437 stop:1546 length:1110 start_codon:yes stop_codon:yes gene_type:complete